jgi:hypothetical protein
MLFSSTRCVREGRAEQTVAQTAHAQIKFVTGQFQKHVYKLAILVIIPHLVLQHAQVTCMALDVLVRALVTVQVVAIEKQENVHLARAAKAHTVRDVQQAHMVQTVQTNVRVDARAESVTTLTEHVYHVKIQTIGASTVTRPVPQTVSRRSVTS